MSDTNTLPFFKVPKFTQGNSTIQGLNVPLEYIEDALNQIISHKGDTTLLMHDIATATDVSVGDVVYFNATTGLFQKAIAALADMPGIEGQSIQAQSSKVQGILIGENPNILFLGGSYKNTAVVSALLGTNPQPGIYYLSPTIPGKVTKQPGWSLRQPCISYFGNDQISFISHYLAHDSHHHFSYVVPAGTAGTAGRVQYTVTDTEVKTAISNYTTACFLDGKLDINNEVKWDGSILSWPAVTGDTNTVQTDGRVVLFTHMPFAYGDAIVRQISSQTLNVSADSGKYKVETKQLQFNDSQSNKSAWAISQLKGNTAIRTPIVSHIQSNCPQLTVNKTADGVYTIESLSGGSDGGQYLKADQIKLDGAQRVSQGLFTYSVLPSGIRSSLSAYTSLFTNNAVKRDISCYITHKGSIPSNVKLSLYVLDLEKTELGISQTPVATKNLSSAAQTVLQMQLASSVQIPKKCVMLLKVDANSPGSSVYIFNIGLKIKTPATA